MPIKKEPNPKSKIKKNNVYTPYYSEEFRDLVRYIQDTLKRPVYLIGVRAMYERGVPAYRLTEDFDIHSPLTKAERDEIIKFVRKKYKKSKEIWSKFGFGLDFYPVGKMRYIDVNIISPEIIDESWEEEMIEINGVSIYLPPIEDILILKLLSPRKKDMRDIGSALHLALNKINLNNLIKKAQKVGVIKKLIRVAKKYSISID